MTDQRSVKEIFGEAVELPAGRRRELLDAACGEDGALRSKVESLLALHEGGGGFLGAPTQAGGAPGGGDAVGEPLRSEAGGERSLFKAATALDGVSLREQPGAAIGRYRLLQPLGEGGFGSVFMAEQREPVVRRVALKIIKLGMDTRQVIARFEAERQALAMMDHPNIARVLDAGATDSGRPYFVMELVKGVPITEFCDTNRLGTRERLALFGDVCQAVQHAHQKGVIHRDLKPSNVLVTRYDGRPVVKIIDFGIAKAIVGRLTERTLFTELRQMVGTPVYMSPEQAGVSDLDVDTRSDIYSLGVLLYELLIGTTPLDTQALARADVAEAQRLIREAETPKPSTRLSGLLAAADHARLNGSSPAGAIAGARGTDARSLVRLLRGELDWIVMKCLEKDRARRYETADALALDVQRFLQNEPVVAGPPSKTYRVRKFVRRNRVGVAASAALGASLVLGVLGSALGWRQAIVSAGLARREAAKAGAISAFLQQTLAAADPLEELLIPLAREHALGPVARDRKVGDVLDLAAASVDKGEFGGDPLTEAAMRFNIGRVYLNLGQFVKAEKQLRRAHEVQRSLLGPESRETLGTLVELVRAVDDASSDHAELMRRAMESVPRVLGPRDRATLALMQWDAQLAANNYRDDLAVDRLRAVLSVQEQALPEGDPQTLRTMYLLSRQLMNVEQRPEALALARRSVELAVRLQGEDHLTTHMSRLQFLSVIEDRSSEEDLPVARSVVDGVGRHLGPDHENTLDARDALVGVLIDLGRLGEAEGEARRLLDDKARLFGEVTDGAAYTRSRVGEILWKQGRLEDAEAYLNESLRMLQGRASRSGLAFPSGLRQSLFDVYKLQGRLPEALGVAREALALARAFPPEGGMGTAANSWRDDLIYVLTALGQLEEAEKVAREQVGVLRQTRGDDHACTLRALNGLAWCLFLDGRFDEAEGPAREAVEGYRRADNPDVLDRINTTDTLAVTLCALGRPREAEPLFREILELLGRGTPARFFAGDAGLHALHYGECLMQLGRGEEARGWLIEALGTASRAPGAEARQTVATARRRLDELGHVEESEEAGERPPPEKRGNEIPSSDFRAPPRPGGMLESGRRSPCSWKPCGG